jgi:hypothetical protein
LFCIVAKPNFLRKFTEIIQTAIEMIKLFSKMETKTMIGNEACLED